MKKIALILVVLTLCLTMLTSCSGFLDGIAPQATSGIIDSIQSEYEGKGYKAERADAEQLEKLNTDFKEVLDLDLKGEFIDYLSCGAVDENGQAETIYAYGLSEYSDGAKLADRLKEYYGMTDFYDYEVVNMGWVVTIRLSYTYN